jgi:5'-methylthioadenosine phosphorylase
LVDSDVEIGIIGGTGVYEQEIIEDVEEAKVYTPYGRPSDLISVGYYAERKIAFLPRHGRSHQIPPHNIPFRANIWALKELGVKRVIAASAVGSLREDYKPSEFVILDQFIDRTKNRGDTFYDGGQICHISTADPFCPELRETFIASANVMGLQTHEKGTYICIQGPRFSTRAESELFRGWGVDVIGMTLFPEVVLAREVGMCYVSVSMVTDYDVWADKPVTAQEIFQTMGQNAINFRKLIMETLPKIPKKRNCSCEAALEEAI